ncbi:PREDICTED: uncharacterized protein LOC104766120 [Camelina sativa]|uniref:Uncharacterized protein LOC104766120 n=1 Tax=Camelina sativa TaxID=90675 RepID=A0ABM0XMS9_CAMSA|nr:PREDICTED: uncharacterized protein LOC104766120 [Camelina sativa]
MTPERQDRLFCDMCGPVCGKLTVGFMRLNMLLSISHFHLNHRFRFPRLIRTTTLTSLHNSHFIAPSTPQIRMNQSEQNSLSVEKPSQASSDPYTPPPPIGYPTRDAMVGDPPAAAVETKSKDVDESYEKLECCQKCLCGCLEVLQKVLSS